MMPRPHVALLVESTRAYGRGLLAGVTSYVRRHGAWIIDWQERNLSEAPLADWLHGLPKPVGVLACNDVRGQQVLNACRRAGLAVPDEVAVLGVDNNELVCNLADPPLSSVDANCERIGYEAAALLDRL